MFTLMSDGQEDQEQETGGVAASPRPRHRKGNTAVMVAVLANHGTQEEAARAAGISPREVRRRLREPGVQRMLRSARREQLRLWMAKIAVAGPKGLDTLLELLSEQHPVDTRFKAAKEVVRATEHNFDRLAMREELDDVQAQLEAMQSEDDTDLD
jgi:hypothetical protein